MSFTLAGTSIDLISYNLDDICLDPLLLTHKPIYSVSVCSNNDFSVFTFNNDSASLCRTFSNVFHGP